MSSPRHIGSASPFESSWFEYHSKGWSVVPLPENKKKSPPGKDDGPQNESFTGRNGRFATEDDYAIWSSKDSPWHKGNIAIRAGNDVLQDGIVYEVIGIDVDAYDAKNGAAHLKELEASYGVLPSTWTSSARSDGVSGIRWFLAPKGYEYMGKPRLRNGKASDSIEIVQRVHRYGLVFPSYHPELRTQYWWYATGQSPDGIHTSPAIPRVERLAVLPESWFQFLTRQGTESTGASPIDMDIDVKELNKWAQRKFSKNREKPCKTTKACFKNHRDKVENAADHHQPLVDAHWNLFLLGAEGHSHWSEAVKAINKSWMKRVATDNVRTLGEARAEIARSQEGALRKIKGRDDDWKAQGLAYLVDQDPCGRDGHAPPPLIPPTPAPITAAGPPQYERNEDGNAKHMLDTYNGNLRYVPNHASGQGCWLIFQQEQKRWFVDDKDVEVRNMYREVKKQQMSDAEIRLAQSQVNLQQANDNGVVGAQLAAIKRDVADAREWVKWANESGNKARVSNSLAQAQTYTDVSLDFSKLDANDMLLPVANGVIKFATREERLAGANPYTWIQDPDEIRSLLVTQNTHVPYIPYEEQATHKDPEVQANFEKFESFIRPFLKDQLTEDSWSYVLKLLGLSILGVPSKKAIFLVGKRDTGKSTFQSMMNAALGELSIWRDPAIFEDSNFKSSLAEALPKRVAMVGELGEKHMDASLFKRITGGDEVSCQLKNINKPATLRARCTVISGCNSAPDIPNVDDATKERFVVIPFRHQVGRAEKDVNAQDELTKACKVPLLALLIEHADEAIMHGVQEVPLELQLETKAFVSSLSEMSDFVNDCLVKVPDTECKKYAAHGTVDLADPKPRYPDDLCIEDDELYREYERYCKVNNLKDVLSKNTFTRRMQDADFLRDGSFSKNNKRRWIGVIWAKGYGRVHRGENV